ncbi:unnamed protein product [Phytophthora lilii]|uniref:Unnamed protein product n=1 Tax=Phytophthora lilii TaxID=2077276 RepID=A0A9W6WV15_9STRA|nr:unnamed protein product [Phytophthora lilii]
MDTGSTRSAMTMARFPNAPSTVHGTHFPRLRVECTYDESRVHFSKRLRVRSSLQSSSSTPLEMSRATLSVALVATAAAVVSARPTYVALIPNGANVPGVEALGHINPAGGGANNDFGLDFASAGKSWTKEFCEKDSDGDGQTNGQELGDPCCEWVESSNAVVKWKEGLSHPGNATSKSDPSLWANISCGSSSNSTSTTTTTAGSSTGSTSSTVEAGSTTAPSTGASTPSTDTTTSSAAAASSSAASASSSAASAVTPAMYSAVGLAAAVVAFFM